MRLITKCILLLPMLGTCCVALPMASQQPTISIATKTSTVKSGHLIRICVFLKNTTDMEFTIFQSVGGGSGEQYYSVSVTGPDGNPATLTKYGAAALKHIPVPGSRIMRTVKPSGTAKVEYVTVSHLFQMTAPGTYVVQVSRPSPFNHDIILKSNTLIIKVINKK